MYIETTLQSEEKMLLLPKGLRKCTFLCGYILYILYIELKAYNQ